MVQGRAGFAAIFTLRGQREVKMEFADYYKTLDLNRGATEEQVWLAYNKIVFLHKTKRRTASLERLLQAEEAYNILINRPVRYYIYNKTHRPENLPVTEKLPENLRGAAAVFLTSFFSVIVFYFALA